MIKKLNVLLQYKKQKNINNKLKKKIEELEANNEFLFNENQMLKSKIRKKVRKENGKN